MENTQPVMQINQERIQAALTSRRWEWCYLQGTTHPATVQEALSEQLPHIDPGSWLARAAHGGIYLNGRAAELNTPLTIPCRLEYFEPVYNVQNAEQHFPAYMPEWIVYRDADLIVVNKPQGLPCLPNREQRSYNLKTYLERACGQTLHLPSRLDTSTGGLVIISASERMHAPLQQAFENRTIAKFYLLKTSSPPPQQELEVHCQIGQHPDHPILRQVVPTGGREAHTHFQILDRDTDQPAATAVLARPHSGRTHQLRVQMQHLGCPIIGDNFYGGAPAARLHLFCFRLRFLDPFSKKTVDITLPEKFSPDWLTADQREQAISLSAS